MANCKVEKIIENGLAIKARVQLSLTGPNSHRFVVYRGEGFFSIGVKGIDKGDIRAWVNADDKINWDVIDEVHLRNWPRFIQYTGNDSSFINWSQKKRLERFFWQPLKDMQVDFTKANIYQLYIKTDHKLNLSFGNQISSLDLHGNPNNFVIEQCDKLPSLGFKLKQEDSLDKYMLPQYKCFHEVKELSVELDPNGAPFDCASLLQFPNLELLHLIGNVTNLQVLSHLKHLKKLGFRNAFDLSGLPSLNTWEHLDKFVAQNIDEKGGLKLRREYSKLKKIKTFDYVYIGKLRNKIWFETEYGIPFSRWAENLEKKATRAYKKCLQNVKNALTKEDIKEAVIEFTESINKLEDIESVERDDTYTALCLIMENSPIEINRDDWGKWFEETRDF